MCLAVPGRLLEITDDDPIMRSGTVAFGGITKTINLAYTPEARPGQYVLVHVGFALAVIDEIEAKRVLDTFAELDAISEAAWRDSAPAKPGGQEASHRKEGQGGGLGHDSDGVPHGRGAAEPAEDDAAGGGRGGGIEIA